MCPNFHWLRITLAGSLLLSGCVPSQPSALNGMVPTENPSQSGTDNLTPRTLSPPAPKEIATKVNKNPVAGKQDSARSEASAEPPVHHSEQTPQSVRPWSVQNYDQFFSSEEFLRQLGFSERIHQSFGKQASTSTSKTANEVLQLCRESMKRRGWKEGESQVYELPQNAVRTQLIFNQQGHAVSIVASGPNSESEIQLIVKYQGNIDVRSLPVPHSCHPIDGNQYAYAAYTTGDSIADAAQYCRQSMQQQGWSEFRCISRTSSLPRLTPPNMVIGFAQAGFSCYLTVSRTAEYQAGKTVVAYATTGILPIDMPFDGSAEELEIDVLVGRAQYRTRLTPQKVREPIEASLTGNGYKLVERGGEQALIDIYKRIEDEQTLVDITPLDSGLTSVQIIRQFSADLTAPH